MTMISLALSVCNPIYQRRGSPPVITATTAPTLSALTDAQTPADGYTAGTYSSTAGTISSAVETYYVNDVEVASTYDLAADDVVRVSVLVTDSVGNTRTFSTGTVTVTAAPLGAITTWADYRQHVETTVPQVAGYSGSLTPVADYTLPSGVTYDPTAYSGQGLFSVTNDGTSQLVIEGIDFGYTKVEILGDGIVVQNCLCDAIDAPIGFGNGGARWEVQRGSTNVVIRDNTFRGRRGYDYIGRMIGHNSGGTDPVANGVTIYRNLFEHLSCDAIYGGFDNLVVQQNWFKSVYNYEDGTREYDAGITFASGDYAISGERYFRSLQDGNLGNTPPGTATSDTFWEYVGPKPHYDGSQYVGENVLFLGNLMDATGPANELYQVNNLLRLVNEGSANPWPGLLHVLGNVLRMGQGAGQSATAPDNAIHMSANGGAYKTTVFDGNSVEATSNAVRTDSDTTVYAALTWGSSNVDGSDTTLTKPDASVTDGDATVETDFDAIASPPSSPAPSYTLYDETSATTVTAVPALRVSLDGGSSWQSLAAAGLTVVNDGDDLVVSGFASSAAAASAQWHYQQEQPGEPYSAASSIDAIYTRRDGSTAPQNTSMPGFSLCATRAGNPVVTA